MLKIALHHHQTTTSSNSGNMQLSEHGPPIQNYINLEIWYEWIHIIYWYEFTYLVFLLYAPSIYAFVALPTISFVEFVRYVASYRSTTHYRLYHFQPSDSYILLLTSKYILLSINSHIGKYITCFNLATRTYLCKSSIQFTKWVFLYA